MDNYVGTWRLMRRDTPTGKVCWLNDRLTKRDAQAMWETATTRSEEGADVQFWIEPDVASLNFAAKGDWWEFYS